MTIMHGQSSAIIGQVQCHSGYDYAQRPIAIYPEGERLKVERVEGEWKTPDGKFFRVLTAGDQVFELLYNVVEDKWFIQRNCSG